MSLDLNTEQEHIRIDGKEIPFFREFYGQNVKQAPKVKEAGRVLAPVFRIMERKANSPKDDWRTNYFDSGSHLGYPAEGTYNDGRFKIAEISQNLRNMDGKNELIDRGLVVSSYEELDGIELTRKDAKFNEDLQESEVPDHPGWLAFFGGNRELLGQVTQEIFKKTRDTHDYKGPLMGIYLARESKKPHVRAAFVDGLGNRSRLGGWDGLDDDYGRLVGVAPEALGAPDQLVKPYTERDLEAFDKSMKGLNGVVKPELLESLTKLRETL